MTDFQIAVRVVYVLAILTLVVVMVVREHRLNQAAKDLAARKKRAEIGPRVSDR